MNKIHSKLKIITNNPLVKARYPDMSVFLETGAEGVLVKARDRIHSGAVILNHPMSGDVSQGVCPYKSLILSDAGEGGFAGTNFESLQWIESALGTLRKPPERFGGYGEKTLEDFQVLDLDILDCALTAL